MLRGQHYLVILQIEPEYDDASHQLYSRVSDGRLKVYIHDKMPLEKIVEAHNELEGRKTKGGIVITL